MRAIVSFARLSEPRSVFCISSRQRSSSAGMALTRMIRSVSSRVVIGWGVTQFIVDQPKTLTVTEPGTVWPPLPGMDLIRLDVGIEQPHRCVEMRQIRPLPTSCCSSWISVPANSARLLRNACMTCSSAIAARSRNTRDHNGNGRGPQEICMSWRLLHNTGYSSLSIQSSRMLRNTDMPSSRTVTLIMLRPIRCRLPLMSSGYLNT